ncbi:MAG: FxSxx-COOH system tetratricopeptide repeat protein [bacterium]|nr:FxSxx-COOH system tetratricopeptide repeat protein [bacterium]
MKDFFISYNRADRTWAEWIAWQLEEAGYSVVLQAWDFRPGCNFVLEMDRAAVEAERTIPVLSPAYLSALYTQPEWAAAFAQDPTGEKGTLLPVRVQECELKGLLAQILYIDLAKLDEPKAKEALLEGIKRERAKPTVKPGFPGRVERSVAEQPRFPGSLPPIWNIPHNRNPNFTGRKELLAALRRALVSKQPTALTQAISGLGGVGKTQLAVEYAYRHAADYDVVWWIRAEEPAALAADLAALAGPLNLPQKDATDQRVIIHAVRSWLDAGQARWLLILDNARGPEELPEYLPQSRLGHLIITSRNPNWLSVAAPLSVQVWSPDEATRFLLKRTRQTDENAAAKLAEELGDLPLALEQAGAYIEETDYTISAYLELFRSRRGELWEEEHPPTDYPYTVAATLSLSVDKVLQESPVAADLLNLLAFLGPDEIPLSIVTGGRKHLPKALSAAAKNAVAINRGIKALRQYSLVERSGDSVTVHRLVQAVVRDRLDERDKKKWAQAAVRLVNDALPVEAHDVRTWPECARLLPHALSAAEHAEKLGVAPEATGRVLNQVGVYLWGRAEFREAKAALERALSIDEAAFGPNHPEVATHVNNLGNVLEALGDLKGAKKCCERALSIDEAAFGPNHPNVGRDVNNLGTVLRDLGDLKGAKKCCERALSIDEAALGPNHPNVASIVNNLAGVLKALGDLKGAKKCYERALSIDEAAFGPNHPNVARDVSNLGLALHAVGDLKGAKKCYERALSIDEAAFGPNHPNVATDVNNLGSILKALGDLKGARKCCERALRIFREFLGDDHPKTVTVRKNLELLGV